MTITVDQAQPDDVLLDSEGTVWQRGRESFQWATFAGLYGFYGEWDPGTMGPQGELTVLVRDGKVVGLSK